MVVAAKLKASFDQALSIGWQAERFRREGKNMKPLSDYLKAPVPEPVRRETGAQDLRAMISGRMQRQRVKSEDSRSV